MIVAEALIGIVIVVSFIGIFASWFTVLFSMFRAVANRKEGVPLFPNWYENPFNILFRPSQLTERGLTARRRCFHGVVGFFLSMATFVAAEYLHELYFPN